MSAIQTRTFTCTHLFKYTSICTHSLCVHFCAFSKIDMKFITQSIFLLIKAETRSRKANYSFRSPVFNHILNKTLCNAQCTVLEKGTVFYEAEHDVTLE